MQVNDNDIAEEALAIAEAIRPLLAGKRPSVQGVVIAELAGRWLAGHVCSDREHTIELRKEMWRMYCRLVWELTRANAREMDTDR